MFSEVLVLITLQLFLFLSAVSGAACSIPPDHDVGRGSPEPDLGAPHHLPEMDTDTPR